jgi:small multidrug resistance pump
MSYVFLSIAIISEVIGTLALKSSAGFTRLAPSILTTIGYGSAFYFLSLTLKELKIGVVYAIWSGVGIILVSVFAALIHHQKIDPAGWLGMGLIIAGVVVLNLYSEAKLP